MRIEDTSGRSSDPQLQGRRIIDEIQASGIEYVMSVPDIVTSKGLLHPLARERSPRLIRLCREDEGVGIAAGLAFCNKRALLLIQYTGLLDSINAIRVVGVEYKLPICMMVGLLGHEPGLPPRQSPRYGVRIVEPILEAMGVAHHVIDRDADLAQVRPAIDHAYARSQPLALLIARRPVAP
jgi:sulfopyruvate decarboxylase TPP-binding subunit